MAILVDTSVLIAHERARVDLPTGDDLAIAAITASELLQGTYRGQVQDRVRRQVLVDRILEAIPVIAFDLDVARVHARLWAELALRGGLPPAHDLLVAATAISRGWPVATLDARHFGAIPGLTLWEP